jgi:membrane protease YdiL (CAAX protease family)
VQVAGFLLLLRWMSHAELYQIGLTTHRWFRNLLLGSLGWLVLSPLIFGLNFLVTLLYIGAGATPEEHPLMLLTQGKLLALIVAIVVAPVLEELWFRGVLQNWLERQPKGANAVVAVAMVFALYQRGDKIQTASGNDDLSALAREFQPAIFVAILAAGFFLLRRLPWRRIPANSAQAIYFTALLFAAGHSGVWPSPIPLFVFGLGLGYLAYRTRSLVAPIVAHALLNLVACIMLIFAPHLSEGAINGSGVTIAILCPARVSTSSWVPGSWLPRWRYAKPITVPNRGESTEDVTLPTSLPWRNSFLPGATTQSPESFSPRSDRLTWPRSRVRTMVSCPR